MHQYCKAAIAQVVSALAVIQAFDVGPSLRTGKKKTKSCPLVDNF